MWQELTRSGHPLLQSYGTFVGAAQQHPRSQFLLLVQALEGLHGYEHADEYEQRRGRHLKARAVALANAENMSPENLQFLKKHVSKSPFSSLDDALDEVLNGLPVDLESRLAETELALSLSQDPRPHDRATGFLRLVRNDLAHGTRAYDSYALHETNGSLERVVKSELLRILGFSRSAQERVLHSE